MAAIFKMAAILDFQVASLTDLFSIPMRIIMPNLMLVSQNAQFPLKFDVSRSTKALAVVTDGKILASQVLRVRDRRFESHPGRKLVSDLILL